MNGIGTTITGQRIQLESDGSQLLIRSGEGPLPFRIPGRRITAIEVDGRWDLDLVECEVVTDVFKVEISTTMQAALLRMGWTPPASEH